MNLKTITLIALVLLNCGSMYAQKSEGKRILKLKMCSIQLQAGSIIESNIKETPDDFKQLAPQSALLSATTGKRYASTTGYKTLGDGRLSGNSIFSVAAAFKFGNKQKTDYRKTSLLRIGISYFSETNLSAIFYTKESTVYDTLVSAKSTSAVYLDSVSRKYYNMSYSSNQLRLDVSLIVRTDPYARWSLYTGIGINGGVSVAANTVINYTQYDELETRYQNGSNFTAVFSTNTKTEKHTNKSNMVLCAYVPLGADFRIGTTREFWARTHLFYELRPGISITKIPELSTIANFSFQHGIGLRYSF